MNSRIKRGLQIAVLGGGMWALSAGIASADTPVATPPGVTLTNPTTVAGNNTGNNTGNGAQPTSLLGNDQYNGRNGEYSSNLTGGLALGLSSTSTNSGDRSFTDQGNRSNLLGNNQYNGRGDTSSLTGGLALGLSSTSTNSGGYGLS